MTNLNPVELLELVAEARLAPSVHNIQPTRWQLHPGGLRLLGDPRRVVPVADPTGRDWRLSHGAALEGMALALGRRGKCIAEVIVLPAEGSHGANGLIAVADLALGDRPADAVVESVSTRTSWRGAFRQVDAAATSDLDRLSTEREDLTLVRDRDAVADVAALADRAAIHFLRQDEHRTELLAWMRLSRTHPNFELDGLNAEALNLRPFEAWAAGLLLKHLFRPLDRLGLAAVLTSDRAKAASAAAIALFHRPADEDPLTSGREFYRAWLAIERHGFKACPVSVLADWPFARTSLVADHSIGSGRQLVNAFRLGRPDGVPMSSHARLPPERLVVREA